MKLVCPAGHLAMGLDALNCGADAIYFGVDALPDMRNHNAHISSRDRMSLVARARKTGAHTYVAMNAKYPGNLVDVAFKRACQIYEEGVDAFIVADAGLINMLNESKIPFHWSVQLAVAAHTSATIAKKLGARRVVLERFMTPEEAGAISRKTGIEVEVFGYGPQCIAVDALCFLGCFFKRRACENQCMAPYQGPAGNGRHLYMGHFHSLFSLPELVRQGVSALKVEGRSRSAHFVRLVTRTFREALDECLADPDNYRVKKRWLKNLHHAALYVPLHGGHLSPPCRRPETLKWFSWRSHLAYLAELANITQGTLNARRAASEILLAAELDTDADVHTWQEL